MRFVPFGAFAVAALLATSACGRQADAPPPEAATGLSATMNPTEFLSGNALTPGVKTTPSGLQYQIVKSGAPGGAHPTLEDQVTVNYAAILLDGTVVDSSYARGEPATFPLRGLVPAWEEALPMMVPGDEWLLWAPPQLGYGVEGKGDVPPNAVLKFRIQLVKVN